MREILETERDDGGRERTTFKAMEWGTPSHLAMLYVNFSQRIRGCRWIYPLSLFSLGHGIYSWPETTPKTDRLNIERLPLCDIWPWAGGLVKRIEPTEVPDSKKMTSGKRKEKFSFYILCVRCFCRVPVIEGGWAGCGRGGKERGCAGIVFSLSVLSWSEGMNLYGSQPTFGPSSEGPYQIVGGKGLNNFCIGWTCLFPFRGGGERDLMYMYLSLHTKQYLKTLIPLLPYIISKVKLLHYTCILIYFHIRIFSYILPIFTHMSPIFFLSISFLFPPLSFSIFFSLSTSPSSSPFPFSIFSNLFTFSLSCFRHFLEWYFPSPFLSEFAFYGLCLTGEAARSWIYFWGLGMKAWRDEGIGASRCQFIHPCFHLPIFILPLVHHLYKTRMIFIWEWVHFRVDLSYL